MIKKQGIFKQSVFTTKISFYKFKKKKKKQTTKQVLLILLQATASLTSIAKTKHTFALLISVNDTDKCILALELQQVEL